MAASVKLGVRQHQTSTATQVEIVAEGKCKSI